MLIDLHHYRLMLYLIQPWHHVHDSSYDIGDIIQLPHPLILVSRLHDDCPILMTYILIVLLQVACRLVWHPMHFQYLILRHHSSVPILTSQTWL